MVAVAVLALVSVGTLTATQAPAAASPRAQQAVDFALAQVGKPYKWAAEGPHAYDCSGLTSAAWASAGVPIPRTSSAQYAALPPVSRHDLRPGDLLFYYSPVSHAEIYVGGGTVVTAPSRGRSVRVEPIDWSNVVGARAPAGSRGASSASASGLLEQGDRGPAVEDWQRDLNAVRHRHVGIDGAFGPETNAATRSFQADRGLVVDGLVGPNTRAAMRRARSR